jgi:hypothetical protein
MKSRRGVYPRANASTGRRRRAKATAGPACLEPSRGKLNVVEPQFRLMFKPSVPRNAGGVALVRKKPGGGNACGAVLRSPPRYSRVSEKAAEDFSGHIVLEAAAL